MTVHYLNQHRFLKRGNVCSGNRACALDPNTDVMNVFLVAILLVFPFVLAVSGSDNSSAATNGTSSSDTTAAVTSLSPDGGSQNNNSSSGGNQTTGSSDNSQSSDESAGQTTSAASSLLTAQFCLMPLLLVLSAKLF
ncbi:hypothetical protein SprV_0401427100 [Sparganum proliferum]